jgi:hypothetical protein
MPVEPSEPTTFSWRWTQCPKCGQLFVGDHECSVTYVPASFDKSDQPEFVFGNCNPGWEQTDRENLERVACALERLADALAGQKQEDHEQAPQEETERGTEHNPADD